MILAHVEPTVLCKHQHTYTLIFHSVSICWMSYFRYWVNNYACWVLRFGGSIEIQYWDKIVKWLLIRSDTLISKLSRLRSIDWSIGRCSLTKIDDLCWYMRNITQFVCIANEILLGYDGGFSWFINGYVKWRWVAHYQIWQSFLRFVCGNDAISFQRRRRSLCISFIVFSFANVCVKTKDNVFSCINKCIFLWGFLYSGFWTT